MRGGTDDPRGVRSIRELAESQLAGGAGIDLETLTQDEIRGLVQELEVHKVELEIQNRQLTEAQLEAEESKERYRQLYEQAPIGYLSLDSEGRIEAANLFTSELLGVPRSLLLGRKFSTFVPEEQQDDWHFVRRALSESGVRRSRELDVLLDDGSTLVVQLVSPGRPKAGGGLQLALLDVTERRNAERALRKAASEASLAEQRERRRLASDLHDDAGQLLSLACLKLRALASESGDGPDGSLEELSRLLTEARHRISSLSFQLSPPLLHDVGLVAATRWLAEDLRKSYGLTVSVSAGEELALDEPARITLFRAARELLINVRRHAGVNEARVELWCEGPMARVAVEDEGRGFDRESRPSGFGLLALHERLGQLGGSLVLEQGPRGTGSRIVASAPLATREGEAS